MAWGIGVLGQHQASHLALCFLNTPIAPHAYLVKLLIALLGRQARSPCWIQNDEHHEGQYVEAPSSTWCPKAMAEDGHGGQRWVQWCWAAVGGADPMWWCMALVARLMVALCLGLVAWVQGSVGLL